MVKFAKEESDTRTIGAELGRNLSVGDVVLFTGELGTGKTTMIRGLLEGLGYSGAVRSPTFNLIQTFSTTPPVMHADLYRVSSSQGIGVEEYFDTHVCLIEWPDRLKGLIDETECWTVNIQFSGSGRLVEIQEPRI